MPVSTDPRKKCLKKIQKLGVVRNRYELKCLQKFVVWPFGACECHMSAHYKHRRWAQGVPTPPKLGRNLFYSGKFSERTMGNSGWKFTERLLPP